MKTKALFLFLQFFFIISCYSQDDKDIIIGNQEWKKGILSTPIFNNGDPIPYVKTQKEWRIAGENKKPCYTYLKDIDGKDVTPKKYIYNWYVINDPRGIAPKGYRVPTNSDILELISFCGGICETSKKLKSSFGWDANDLIDADKKTENGSDEYGLALSPIPLILPSGQQNNCYLSSGFWTSTDSENGIPFLDFNEYQYAGHVAYSFNLTFNDCMNYLNLFFKEGGLPIRFIKDKTQRNSAEYPIPILSNSLDNFNIEKAKHVESLCPTCDSISSEIFTLKSLSILKEIHFSVENKKECIFYFDQSNLTKLIPNAGIGAKLTILNGEVIIEEMVKGGSCEMSNLISNKDILIGIFENDKLFEFKNLKLEEVINKIRGQENTRVNLLAKSNSTDKRYEVELVRKKFPNWDLNKLIDKSHMQSSYPTIISNYYYYYKHKLIPDNHKYPNESEAVYIFSAASMLYYSGPENNSLNDSFHYPKSEWDRDELISGAYQLAILFRGGTEFNPLLLKSIKDAENLLLTFHFKIISSEKVKTAKNISKITFEHINNNDQIIIFFKFN